MLFELEHRPVGKVRFRTTKLFVPVFVLSPGQWEALRLANVWNLTFLTYTNNEGFLLTLLPLTGAF